MCIPTKTSKLPKDEMKNGNPGSNCKRASPWQERDGVLLLPASHSHGQGALGTPLLAHVGAGFFPYSPSPLASHLGVSEVFGNRNTAAKKENELYWTLQWIGEAVGHGHSPLPLRCPGPPLLCMFLLHLPTFQTLSKRQDSPWRFSVFSVLHRQEACWRVPFAKQGRSHLHQGLELSNTENLEIILEFNKLEWEVGEREQCGFGNN